MKNDEIKAVSIGNGIRVFTCAGHSFGTDAILLADFAAPKKSDNACDLCSGCGIIPLLWARHGIPAHTTAVELQTEAADLMRQSLAHNALEERITVVEGDFRDLPQEPNYREAFSIITINPPYFPAGSGYESAEASRKLARHALTCTTEDIMCTAAALLKYGGRLCLCHKPEQLADLLCAMRAHSIEPKKIRFVCGKKGKAPYLVLIEGKKGGGRQLKILPELCVQNEDGSWSREMLKIYGEYGDGSKQ